MHKFFLKILLAISLFVATNSCSNDFDEWGYVNFYIEPDTTEYFYLNEGNRGWEYFEGGNRGIIVFRNSHYDFMAYERSCVTKGCKGGLEVDTSNNVIITCPQCKGKWLGFDGSPIENSSSTRMLFSYCAYYDGWRLYVRNCSGY